MCENRKQREFQPGNQHPVLIGRRPESSERRRSGSDGLHQPGVPPLVRKRNVYSGDRDENERQHSRCGAQDCGADRIGAAQDIIGACHLTSLYG